MSGAPAAGLCCMNVSSDFSLFTAVPDIATLNCQAATQNNQRVILDKPTNDVKGPPGTTPALLQPPQVGPPH